MDFLYDLSVAQLFLVLNLATACVALAFWLLPQMPFVSHAARAGNAMSPVIQGVCGTLFVLATTFLSSSVWTAEDKAREAIALEARTVRQIRTIASFLVEPRRSELLNLITDYTRATADEWPRMSERGGGSQAEAILASLQRLAIAAAEGSRETQVVGQKLGRAMDEVGEARERRLDIAHEFVSSDQWAMMIALALTLGLSVVIVHASDAIARAWALAFVALAVGTAFFVVIAHDRPFIGYRALSPQPILEAARGL